MIATSAERRTSILPVNARSSNGGDELPALAGLRVAAVIDTATVSGPARQLLHLTRGLAEHGVHMHVVLFDGPRRLRSALQPLLETEHIEHTVVWERKRSDLSVIPRLRESLEKVGANIVQTHGYRPAVLTYLMRRSGLRTPWIAFAHGVTSEDLKVRLYHRLDRWVSRRADRIVVMSRRHAEEWSDVSAKVNVIYNAVIDAVDGGDLPQTVREQLDRLPRPRVGVIGRLSPEKGVDIFLEALSLLRARGMMLSAVIAGDGPERGALEAEARARGIANSVSLLGAVYPIGSLYRELDAVVIPSRSEGLPNVLLEACRMELPFLATRVGGIPEIVSPHGAGALVEPGSPTALAEGLATLVGRLDDAGWREGRRKLADQVSLRRRIEAHLALYAGVLGRA